MKKLLGTRLFDFKLFNQNTVMVSANDHETRENLLRFIIKIRGGREGERGNYRLISMQWGRGGMGVVLPRI